MSIKILKSTIQAEDATNESLMIWLTANMNSIKKT